LRPRGQGREHTIQRRSGRNLGKETEAGKKTEEENHLASQRPAPAERITITGAQREAEREKRRGGREILLWRGRQERVV